jgi:hypothetical protein
VERDAAAGDPGLSATEATVADDSDSAEYVPFAEFRDGLLRGRFHVVVNPKLARPFVIHRTHATQLGLALIGPGIACALLGYPVAGVLLVAAGIALRRAIGWQAAQILLHLASRHPSTYLDAISHGVMEVQRRPHAGT